MSRPTEARVDLGALVANYRRAKAAAPRTRALAVVKANAYGHGAVAVARALAGEADGFAVACLEEALELRESGITRPVLLLEGVFEPTELALVDRLGLTQVVHRRQQVDWLAAARSDQRFSVWIKIDTGMHRLGFPFDEAAGAYGALVAAEAVQDLTLMTHFARADEPFNPATTRQIESFRACTTAFPAPVSLANSAAILRWPAAHGDWTRPGLMLYGATPFEQETPAASGLEPVMVFTSQIIAERRLAEGEGIGYGARFRCERPTRVGVVAAGYADGYPRHAPDGTPVAVGGKRTRVIGRVSMDMITVDLTDLPQCGIGSPVELWGRTVTANEVAAACGTIPYELFTRVTPRVPRRYA